MGLHNGERDKETQRRLKWLELVVEADEPTIAEAFRIARTSAHSWAMRLVDDGVLVRRGKVYRLNDAVVL